MHEKQNLMHLIFLKFTTHYYVEALNWQYSNKRKEDNFTKLYNSWVYKLKIPEYKEVLGNNFSTWTRQTNIVLPEDFVEYRCTLLIAVTSFVVTLIVIE
jgi:hypothetical protein